MALREKQRLFLYYDTTEGDTREFDEFGERTFKLYQTSLFDEDDEDYLTDLADWVEKDLDESGVALTDIEALELQIEKTVWRWAKEYGLNIDKLRDNYYKVLENWGLGYIIDSF